MEQGEQHGHVYNETIDEIKGKDSEDCDSKVIARFFDMPDKSRGEIIAVTAGACTKAWERDSYRNELLATLRECRQNNLVHSTRARIWQIARKESPRLA